MVFFQDDLPYKLHTGREITISNNVDTNLKETFAKKFDFLVLPLFHPTLKRDTLSIMNRKDPQAKADILLKSSNLWNDSIVCRIKSEINLESPFENIRKRSKYLLKQEIKYAMHMGIYAIILPKFNNDMAINYARIINKILLKGTGNCQIWLSVPLIDEYDYWESFNAFRLSIKNTNFLGVCLEIGQNLPDDNIIRRWLAENIRAVVLKTDLFTENNKGHPILTGKHDKLIKLLFPHKANFIIKGQTPSEDLTEYRNYLCYAFSRTPHLTEMEQLGYQFNDLLQAPLQPLKDNLESQIYEFFEKVQAYISLLASIHKKKTIHQDHTKYIYYEAAIKKALEENFDQKQRIVIMLLGAGRAPLAKAAFKAAIELNRNIYLYAVEKNPNAIMTIRTYVHQNKGLLNGKFEIVCEDIRTWQPPELADILFSELLGSFADNELCPEILDAGQRLLKKNGLNIPYEYSSWLTPISYPIIHNKLKMKSSNGRDLEIPVVVRMQKYYLSSDVKCCFTFYHPKKIPNDDNKRFKTLEFHFKEKNTIHGFAGYFDLYLYKDVKISINPSDITPNLFSWFPIFFPFEKEIIVTPSNILKIHIWRLTSKKKVWYEWQAEIVDNQNKLDVLQITKIHNQNGEYFNMGL